MLGIAQTSCLGYEGCVPKLVTLLQRLRTRDVGPDYTYYGIASPWLQVLPTLQLHLDNTLNQYRQTVVVTGVAMVPQL